MASDLGKRRFSPVPVEMSTKSSKSRQEEGDSMTKVKMARKFVVEPIEQTSKSSGQSIGVNGRSSPPPSKPVRRFAAQPVETSVKSSKKDKSSEEVVPQKTDTLKNPRKFAIEPVETTAKSSRKEESHTSDAGKAPRKFAIQPMSITSRTNHQDGHDSAAKPRAHFAPQPVETQRRHRAHKGPVRRDSELDETPADIPKGVLIKSSRRTFAPQLIDTTSRSRKVSDEKLPVPHNFRTDVTPGHMVNAAGEPQFPSMQNTRRAPLPHERRKERTGDGHGNIRSHSFLCPDLETIESSESEPSEAGSPNRSTSPSTNNDSPLTTLEGNTESYKNGSSKSAGPSETFSKYMMGLEAQRARQMLQEQALAAFPNSDFHEPVEHYVDEDDDIIIDDRPATWEGHEDDEDEPAPRTWRQNTTKVDWDLMDMKKHQEELERAKEEKEKAALKKEQGPSPWWNPATVRDIASKMPDSEMSQMLNRARPPMLGTDLKFPRSQSPEPARFDITQGSHVLRSQMCYLTEQAEAKHKEPKTINGLWGGPRSPVKPPSGDKGLWAGLCSAAHIESHGSISDALPSGLMTPALLEPANPFDETLTHRATGTHLRPPTPPHSRSKLQQQGVVVPRIDSVLNTDQELDELMATEYPDTFITQVFNYLSLGYPSLARPFDEELSKITSISVGVLRQDDEVAKSMPKGYIRIGDDFVGRDDGSSQELDKDEACMRWKALKKYIREWARQEKGMVQVQAAPWGAAARKGSWAW
ncbi:hypothetical protein ANO11243_021850 [Dothideomycetidae sp. 11243]|nr:hypothetical protein ANO11243_021850 [fungal sp. No.11243]